MGKFTFLAVLVVVIMLGSVAIVEAGVPRRIVKKLGPPVLVKVKKVGNKISGFLWKNKGTVATGVALAMVVSSPTPLVQGSILAGLLTACIIVTVLAVRYVPWRRHLVPIVVFLIVFLAICCCGVAVRADTLGAVPVEVAGIMPINWAKVIWNIILIILAFPIPG